MVAILTEIRKTVLLNWKIWLKFFVTSSQFPYIILSRGIQIQHYTCKHIFIPGQKSLFHFGRWSMNKFEQICEIINSELC